MVISFKDKINPCFEVIHIGKSLKKPTRKAKLTKEYAYPTHTDRNDIANWKEK